MAKKKKIRWSDTYLVLGTYIHCAGDWTGGIRALREFRDTGTIEGVEGPFATYLDARAFLYDDEFDQTLFEIDFAGIDD